jgi:hypothetical protein
MIITLHPVRCDHTLSLERDGDALIVNGDRYDFAPMPVGSVMPMDAIGCPDIFGNVTRGSDGVLVIPIRIPHGRDASLSVRHPDPIEAREDGPIKLPE